MIRKQTGLLLSFREAKRLVTLLGHLQSHEESVIECHTVDGEVLDRSAVRIVAVSRRRWTAAESWIEKLSKKPGAA